MLRGAWLSQGCIAQLLSRCSRVRGDGSALLLPQAQAGCPASLQAAVTGPTSLGICSFSTSSSTSTSNSGVFAGAGAAPSYDVSRLASRGVISVRGEEAVEFLQGMTTNDMRPLEQPGTGPIYSVLLTAKGKYLHDLFAYSLPGGAQHLLLDVDAAGVPSALQWLTRFRLRRKVQLADASGQYSVWAAHAASWHTKQLVGGADPQAGGPWRRDPRHPDLGLRGIFDAQQLPPPPAAAAGSSGRKQLAAGMSVVPEEVYRARRWELGIAEGDTEMPTGEVAPLECNLDALHGISYTKGCYIGQERNSFTHYRGIIRRRALPLQLLSQALLEAGDLRLPCPVPIVAAPGKPAVGMLTAHDGEGGIGFMKLPTATAYWDGQAAAPTLRLPEGWRHGPVPVAPQRPLWWPPEWGREEAPPSSAASP